MKTLKLYRPVGLREMELIAEAAYKAFPPRLAWQPIFYSVMNQQYAKQIAFEWNTTDEFSGFMGIVAAFEVDADFLAKYEIQNVGGAIHNELWIPSEDMEKFNSDIIGFIEIVNAYLTPQSKLTNDLELRAKIEKFNR